MTRLRVTIGALSLLLALAAILGAADLRGWQVALGEGRAHAAVLPGDPVGRAIGARTDLRRRAAIQAFRTAVRTPRGFDNGEHRSRVRSAAEALLAEVATTAPPGRAAQAQNLLGVLAVSGGRLVGGETGQDRARSAFETAIRIDPAAADPKYNLELLLRREGPVGTREGPESGSGPRGRSQRGAGSGTPGRGY